MRDCICISVGGIEFEAVLTESNTIIIEVFGEGGVGQEALVVSSPLVWRGGGTVGRRTSLHGGV